MKRVVLLCLLFIGNAMAADFPTPVAASFYPIYNSGKNQYIEPNINMPFDKITTLFIAFAHTYPEGKGARLDFEDTQPDEVNRLPLVVKTAREVNPNIILMLSLGWGHNDWTYISNDYVNNANLFVPSVIAFLRKHHLDGFDIDDESINGSSGKISQANFNAVIKNLRTALDQASKEDNKPYYLTITPAFGHADVDMNNINHFDLINTQNYGGSYPADFIALGYPAKKITQGINSEWSCSQSLPNSKNYAGIFNWTMSADSSCQYAYTDKIAKAVKE